MIKHNTLNINKINQFHSLKDNETKGVYHGLFEFGKIFNSLRFTYRTAIDNDEINETTGIKINNDYYQSFY